MDISVSSLSSTQQPPAFTTVLSCAAFLPQRFTSCEVSKKTARINFPPCCLLVLLSEIVYTGVYPPIWIKVAELGSGNRNISSSHHCTWVSLQVLRICKLAVTELVKKHLHGVFTRIILFLSWLMIACSVQMWLNIETEILVMIW